MPAANFETSILGNAPTSEGFWHMTVAWNPETPAPVAGQFYMLRGWSASEAPLLSRPISVHNFNKKAQTIEFLYEVRGIGTQKLSALRLDQTVSLTGPMGNGFPLQQLTGNVALVGGGIGIAPLLLLARSLRENNISVHAYNGFRTFPSKIESFQAYCTRLEIATESGAAGYHGYITDLIDVTAYDAICTCGPEVMMEKVARMAMEKNVPVYVSKEAKMACGVGACLGCTCMGTNGSGLCVCKDGPVFEGGLVYG